MKGAGLVRDLLTVHFTCYTVIRLVFIAVNVLLNVTVFIVKSSLRRVGNRQFEIFT